MANFCSIAALLSVRSLSQNHLTIRLQSHRTVSWNGILTTLRYVLHLYSEYWICNTHTSKPHSRDTDWKGCDCVWD